MISFYYYGQFVVKFTYSFTPEFITSIIEIKLNTCPKVLEEVAYIAENQRLRLPLQHTSLKI